MERAFAAGNRHAADERHISPHLGHDLLRGQIANARRGAVGAGVNARVAGHAALRVEYDFALANAQRARRTAGNARAAMDAGMNRLRVVAVAAVERTALQKYRRAIARAVHGAERNDLIDRRFHLSAPCGREPCSSSPRLSPARWCSAARSRRGRASPSPTA